MTFVLQKMIVRSKPIVWMSRSTVVTFSRAGTEMEYWTMSGRSSACGSTVISTSSRWYIHETVMSPP